MSDGLIPARRALISLSDKSGLAALAAALARHGVEIISTGGTAAALRGLGHEVRDVSALTGFPEMMDGRVKTLHPAIHGGLLARRDLASHLAAMEEHGIGPIDLLVVNLYPFEATVASGADEAECIENIDIGGPAMIRSAAKNHASVAVVTDAELTAALVEELDRNRGATTLAFRTRAALSAFAATAAYDAAISGWMAARAGDAAPVRTLSGRLIQTLRYGENPHQSAAFYRSGPPLPSLATAVQHQGKELSYNNINDADAALALAAEFAPEEGAAVVVVKHANPCGVALAASASGAWQAALASDPVSAFGGIVALNTGLDGETARAIAEIFTEVVIAPAADEAARAVFAAKKNLRLLTTGGLPDPRAARLSWRQVLGGFLVQEADSGRITGADLRVVTKRRPGPAEIRDLLFAFTVAKHVKSNAIVFARDGATVGIGAGQMSRIDSTLTAARKAGKRAKGAVAASDAFFPFADGLEALAEAGIGAVIQPGGAMRDDEVIAAADAAGIAMVFTGMRHFRH